MKKYLFVALILAVLAGIAVFLVQETPAVEQETIALEDQVPFVGDPGNSIEPALFVGTYEYSEFAPRENGALPMPSWIYTLTLYEEGDELKARLAVDGFQTIIRVNGHVAGNRKILNIIFDSYGPDNMNQPFTAGDRLFSLEPAGEGRYGIIWGELQSNLIQPGQEVFKKIEAK